MKVAAHADIRTATGHSPDEPDEIAAIVAALGDLARVVNGADPAGKSIFARTQPRVRPDQRRRDHPAPAPGRR